MSIHLKETNLGNCFKSSSFFTNSNQFKVSESIYKLQSIQSHQWILSQLVKTDEKLNFDGWIYTPRGYSLRL